MAAPESSSPVPATATAVTTAAVSPATPNPPPPSTPAVRSPGISTMTAQRSEPPRNLRGLNKPKCITCGNVARSRCPFQCCKSCCSKAQNPCHIHVLKPNTTLADRGAPATSSTPEPQQPSEVTPLGPPAKVNSIRQLSNPFAQFNNVHMPLRSRKPLSKKDALVINEWRFAKLKEYKESNIEAENEAFDRYMQNASLLEEVFDMMSERAEEDSSSMPVLPAASSEKVDEKAETVSEMKAKIKSNPVRIDAFRKRVRETVDEGLRNFRKDESNDGSNSVDNEGDLSPSAKKNCWDEKTSAFIELNDKLNRARNEEDLMSCIQMRCKIKGQAKSSVQKAETTDASNEHGGLSVEGATPKPDSSLLKLVRVSEISQDDVNFLDAHFSSLEEIEDL